MGHGRYFPPPSGTYMPLGPLGPIDPYITFFEGSNPRGARRTPIIQPICIHGFPSKYCDLNRYCNFREGNEAFGSDVVFDPQCA